MRAEKTAQAHATRCRSFNELVSAPVVSIMKSVLRLAARPVTHEILARTLMAASPTLKRIGRSRLARRCGYGF